MKKGIVITIVAVVSVIAALIVGINSVPAKAIAYEEKITEAHSEIKIQEKRRADLYPTLADAIKSCDKHEYETIVDAINARKEEDGSITDETVNEINSMVKVVLEAYPELTSNENYKEFIKESTITENKIAETRSAYNKAVSRYNTYTRHPIKKFFLNMTGYEVVEFEKLSYNVSQDAPTNLFD